jgi:capsular polysaccharide biosynthesis protein
LILGLRKRIAVRSRGENMFEISCRSGDPREARAVVNVLDEMFVVRHAGVFSVYKRPQLPQRPAAPNLAKATAAGVFLGACAGAGLVLFLKYKELQTGS